ncbi:hypothetical protein LOC67_10265 [Stieleria sp. JC731]|uniref:hypothetical protein n=1 Tax=Pirellulaceae TaxID=2691357 RepID=UPI001E33FA13|nr:hypothetical protein [Stieleria sp. JC731]MCC9600951.1 hypothetical protein [Stieleria sp. JC731]
MRCFYFLLMILVSGLPSFAQDGDRILDEAEGERIADEAEDLKLLEEFAELEQTVSVKWNPSQAEPSGEIEDGLLIPFKLHEEGGFLAEWPTVVACTREMAYQVLVPVVMTKTKTISATSMVPETKTRTMNVVKHRTETRTRTVPVSKVVDGKTITETITQDYAVQVPYTEQVTQEYTVCVPVTEEKTVEVPFVKLATECRTKTVNGTCYRSQLVHVQPNDFPIFRGDRRPADWTEFEEDVTAEGELYVAVFQTEDDWIADFDTVFDPEAYVIILSQVSELPKTIETKATEECCSPSGMIFPLPALAKRSQQPDHQFAFSPYIEMQSRRPFNLVSKPMLPSQWMPGNLQCNPVCTVPPEPVEAIDEDVVPAVDNNVANNAIPGDDGITDWIFEIQLTESHWTSVEGSPMTALQVEHVLSDGDSFIVSPSNPKRFAWQDVFLATVPVYSSTPGPTSVAVEDQDIRQQIEISIAANEALKQGDAEAIIELVTKDEGLERLDAHFYCQAAYLLHRQGHEGMAQALVFQALEEDAAPLNRQLLVRSQGNSRLWLEHSLQDLPRVAGKVSAENRSKLDRMSEIYDQLMSEREMMPALTASTPAVDINAAIEAPLAVPVPVAVPAPPAE